MNSKQSLYLQRGVCVTLVAVGVSLCVGAHAEYLCKAPPLPEDKRACELAKLDRPDALRQFIQRTQGTYDLNMLDYVTDEDVARWELARQQTPAQPAKAVASREQGRTR
jgi:hypothetical protein